MFREHFGATHDDTESTWEWLVVSEFRRKPYRAICCGFFTGGRLTHCKDLVVKNAYDEDDIGSDAAEYLNLED
jgi:hypothetical protein